MVGDLLHDRRESKIDYLVAVCAGKGAKRTRTTKETRHEGEEEEDVVGFLGQTNEIK